MMRSMENELQVVFGAGQVGRLLAERLVARGSRVRVVRRSSGAPTGAELLQGDAADPQLCARAVAGARVVYHCLNPPYDSAAWAKLVPRYMDNLIVATGEAGARLVVLDNLYMLGRTAGVPMNEDTPINPCSRKGEIRARAAERLFSAHRRGEVQAVSGRASDYYGPGGELTHLGAQFWKPALAGKRGRLLIDPDAVHTYHYIPDVAAALAVLGTGEEDVLGRAWMLPCARAGSLRQLIERFATALGRPLQITVAHRWLLKLGAHMVPFLREIDEMRYQWEEPFVVDDRRFRQRFGLVPIPLDEAAKATVDWATRAYGT